MSLAQATKKRKRDEAEENDQEQITFSVLDHSHSSVGPVLASFPCLRPPHKTPFKCFVEKTTKSVDNEGDFASQAIHIAGETEEVEYYSTAEKDASKFYVGVRNKRTNKLTIRPAPIQMLARRVKALKDLAPAPSTSAERIEARNTLGITFGTKKAQKAIRAAERNKVDIAAMEGVTGHLQESIDANTATLPSKEEAKAVADSSRLIPTYNPEASTPSDAYPLHNIIPKPEFKVIPTANLMNAKDGGERLKTMPFQRSEWIGQHLKRIFSIQETSKLVKSAKIIMYISAMFSFKLSAAKLCNNKEALSQRLGGFPPIIIDGLLSRFTETTRGAAELRVTHQTETLLLTHMFALCLHVDGFATDTAVLARDLNMPVDKVNTLFKSLGCKIEQPSVMEIRRLGLPDSAADGKRAILKTPLEFPKPKGKRRK